jgi:starvation-inducible outer membrane lipoprotein
MLLQLGAKPMKRYLLSALAALAIAGCATPPNRIKPIANAAPCTTADRARLAELWKVQSATATNDAVGVFLVGLPVGSMVGAPDHKDEIARLKGRCQ